MKIGLTTSPQEVVNKDEEFILFMLAMTSNTLIKK
jgi:hypothetical protein